MTRFAAVLLVLAGGVTTALHHAHTHPKRVTLATVAAPRPLPRVALLRANRGERRLPLRAKSASPVRNPPRVIRSGSHLHDVTMYCATGSRNAAGRWPQRGDVAVMDRSIPFGTRVFIDGNVYTVEDWIGSGSEFDIYGGSDGGCEQRALNFGRRHLRVVIAP